ncbi:hypothetical protein DFH06DRAFT_1350766 [Mycena polygramma]|nr:hypothetical protein DFH06DRAFT_1350766 [Mycena polygramma]
MSKRKHYAADEEDINDGSGSDDGAEGYTARTVVPRVHLVPHESISVARNGDLRSTFTSIPTPASPSKKDRLPRERPPDPPPKYPQGWQDDYSEFDAEYGPGVQTEARDLRDSDNPNEQWARLDREDFLDEFLRHDGRGEYLHQATCAGARCACPDAKCAAAKCQGATCKSTDFPFRCLDCLHPCLHCEECVRDIHQRMPLHAIEEWTGLSFVKRPLKSLGVRIQLGHPPGEICVKPVPAHGDAFVIVTSHTINEVGLDFCNCETAKLKPIQLLRMRLYPATGTNPRSAGTFAGLRRFDHMTLESKCSAYEYYNSLAQETDNTGLDPSRERYDEFLRMARQWQHLQLLKRAARGHSTDANRINDTKAGEVALLCPACPQPGKNLPPDWANLPFEKVFIYALYLAIDANFRLKRKDVSSEKKDPGLVKGWAFFGDVTHYMTHLDKFWDQKQDRSTCVSHDAVDKPDRESLGTASSGIGTVDCARHNMKRPNGVGDLQKGERYLNMDYLFFMSLRASPLRRLYVSYDIACQWHKTIWERMKVFSEYPEVQFIDGTKYLVFLVPKFHLPAHIELCNILFSFNLTPFVGRTDGEAPERGWADANRLANSTSISGPGARRDTLDVHFQYWNWKKIVGLGRTLLDRMKKYLPLMLETRAAWVDIEASFPPAVIEAWTLIAVTWEKDERKPNPFRSTVKHENLPAVRLKLAVIASEDKTHERVRGDMHETEMLSMGLQLEEQQRALATHVQHVGPHETVDQGRRRVDRETKLRRKIDSWTAVQQLFIPEVTLLRVREDEARNRAAATQVLPGVRAQDIKLFLPSGIGRHAQCDLSLQDYEYQLRKGQAFAALDEMRGQLLVRTREYIYMDGSTTGNSAKTRSQTRIKGTQARIDQAGGEYRAAYSALTSIGSLLGRTEWEKHLKPLMPGDARARPDQHFGDEERQNGGRSKSKRQKKQAVDPAASRQAQQAVENKMAMSWIWLVQDGSEAQEDLVHNEVLRIEWAKTRAKAMRYAEEVDLLEEEMRRVRHFLEWCAGWWRSQVGLRAHLQPDEALREGHAAYAAKQAGYMEGLAARFADHWKDIPRLLEITRAAYATMQPDDDDDEVEEGEREDTTWLSD